MRFGPGVVGFGFRVLRVCGFELRVGFLHLILSSETMSLLGSYLCSRPKCDMYRVLSALQDRSMN